MTSRLLEIQGRIHSTSSAALSADEFTAFCAANIADLTWACARIEALEAALTKIVVMPFDTHEAMMGVPGHEALLGGQDLRVHASMRDIAHSALHSKPEGGG